RLLNTINDIIEISRIEAGEAEVRYEEVDVAELLEGQVVFFKPQADEKGLSLRISRQVTGPSAIVQTDRHKLEGILGNLIKNAIKFTEHGGIELGNYLEDETMQYYVKDTGRGIPEDRLEAVFERFVQADIKINRPHEGSGLGLPIAKAYVEALGGKIWVQSEVGNGSTFNFSIPNHSFAKPQAAPVTDETEPEALPKGLSILIAEDDDTSFLFLKTILAKEGLTLIRTTNGEDTVSAMQETPHISLILMDIKMPRMSGLEAAQRIRQFNHTIPIIAQSAYAASVDKNAALEAGCNDYISKPISRHELIKMIHQYTRE
ncbi:MAG: response regulator, partial [Bacteroidota bacterium]